LISPTIPHPGDLNGHSVPSPINTRHSSSSPLFLLRSSRSEDGAIPRRSPACLQASPDQFGTHDEPRAPFPLLTFPLHPGAPSDILQFFCFTANRGVEPHLHLTVVWSHSSRLSSVLLDALDLSDHADEVAVNARTPSILSPAPGSP
jgi:hypothetical protein